MAINTKYGKLVDGVIQFAENPVIIDGKVIANPPSGIYFHFGFKEIVNHMPKDKEGYHIEENGFDEFQTRIIIKWKYVENEEGKEYPDPREKYQPPRIFSKLYLKITLMKMGLWDRVMYWMENNEIDLGGGVKLSCLEAFETAVTLSDKFEQFPLILKAIQNYLEVSDEVVEQILANSETRD